MARGVPWSRTSTQEYIIYTFIEIIKFSVLVVEKLSSSMATLPDPRFTTDYASDYTGPLFHRGDARGNANTFYLPASVNEHYCRPGYQPKRPNKGVALTVNDYPFHHIQYGGPAWAEVVHTPFHTDN